MPPPDDPKRRAACEQDFGRFCKTYFPGVFPKPWSVVHQYLIDLISMVVLFGALLAIGIPRGWGKTSLCVRAVIWAVAYRHHVFVVLIAASNDGAKQLIADIRDELEQNPLLAADFPELTLPIRALEGVNQRGKAQLSEGQRTKVFASDYELRLGNIGSRFGAVIVAGGIMSSRIRGLRRVVTDEDADEAVVMRPTLGLADDVQTEASAASERSIYRRERVIQAALPGLPGAGEAWSCLATYTVIEPDDLADRHLSRDRHPDWHGVRYSALESLPSDEAMELWHEWNQVREACLRADQPLDEAHQFYRKNKKAMRDGVKVVWEDGYDETRFVDALEQCMDWFFRDRQGFWSELQNNPAGFAPESRPLLQRDLVASRTSHLTHQHCPQEAEYVTAFADVQGKALFYEVRAHASDSSSWVIDYGTWPGQPRQYYTLADIKLTLDSAYAKHATEDARLIAGIKDLFAMLFDREYDREDGQTLRINAAAVDANWKTEIVKRAIRASGFAGRLFPTHGRSFRPPKLSINDLPVKDGDRVGSFWRLRTPRKGQARHLLYDIDHWKTFHRDRLLMPAESPGSCQLYAGRGHEMYADHMLSEHSSLIHDVNSQRIVEVWEHRPERPDNHFLDCAVGNAMLGSMLGCRLPSEEPVAQRSTRKRRRKRGALL